MQLLRASKFELNSLGKFNLELKVRMCTFPKKGAAFCVFVLYAPGSWPSQSGANWHSGAQSQQHQYTRKPPESPCIKV